MKNSILDGPDMVYDWRKNELEGTWVEITEKEPNQLKITKDTITLTYNNKVVATMHYDAETDGKITVDAYYEFIQYHREVIDGKEMGILSVYFMEYDGRGLVIFHEFVKKENRKDVPSDYQSELMKESLGKEAIPTIVMIQPKMYIVCGDHEYVVKPNDTNLAQSLYDQLPLDVEIVDGNENEKVFDLPLPLDTEDGKERDCIQGTVAYSASKNQVIIYNDYSPKEEGLYIIGELSQGYDDIENLKGQASITCLE